MDKTANVIEHESRPVARKPSDAAAVLLCLNFADNIHYKFKSSQSSKARLQSSDKQISTWNHINIARVISKQSRNNFSKNIPDV